MQTTELASPSAGKSKSLPLLGLALFIALAADVAGGIITFRSLRTWYPQLTHPRFTPPSVMYIPVWTVCYILMAIAAWVVWRATRRSRRNIDRDIVRLAARKDAIALWSIQLLLSVGWILSFFYLHRFLVAVCVLLLLWIAMASTLVLFWRIRQLAGALMIPCLAWATFLTALNLVFLRLN